MNGLVKPKYANNQLEIEPLEPKIIPKGMNWKNNKIKVSIPDKNANLFIFHQYRIICLD